jgi:hypothetical protein
MPKTTERYKNFLNTYEFYSNSIQFRIISSKSLEKWKNVQSFQLNQIANGKFFFAQSRKEILLLKYDMWSRFLFEIENFIIEFAGKTSQKEMTDFSIDFILSLAEKTDKTYKEVILDEKNEVFDLEFNKIWLDLHDEVFKKFKESVKSLNGFTFDLFFRGVVDNLVEIMQYMLLEIHELDMMFCKRVTKCIDCDFASTCPDIKQGESENNIPFIIINGLSNKIFTKENCLIRHRIKTYKKYFKIESIYLKNYSSDKIKESILEIVEEEGLQIDYKMCITNN